MPHDTPLIATIVIGLCLAFLLVAIAQRLRVSPLVGYLLAGVALGPHTPGFVADQSLAGELAEIGVILLMFGVGLHFSLKDLWSVRAVAIPGAIVQIAVASVTNMRDHAVLVDFGRVGHWVGEAIERLGVPLLVVDEKDEVVEKLQARGVQAVAGNAITMLQATNLGEAKALLVAIPDSFEAGQIVAQARAANADLLIVARAHSDAEATYLSDYGASVVIQGSHEIADAMVASFSARGSLGDDAY